VDSKRVLLVRRAVADDRVHHDDRWSIGFGACGAQRTIDRFDVIAVVHRLDMPVVRFEPFGAIFGERQARRAAERNVLLS